MSGGLIIITDEMRASARATEPDRYLAALLAPRKVRDDLIALAAFIAELKRIALIVKDPHLAEIRLQWWRDALLSGDAGSAAGNPTAKAMRSLIARHRLDPNALASWLDAFAHTFYAASPEDEAHLDLEHALIEGTAFAFAAKICGAFAAAPQTLDLAGAAYGLGRLGPDFPRILARGRVPLPGLGGFENEAPGVAGARARDRLAALGFARLDAIRAQFAKLDRPARTALLPLALVEPYLRASCAQGHDLTKELAEIAPLTRVWRIWRAHVSGRI
jgi:15-cis-phytoene synthase